MKFKRKFFEYLKISEIMNIQDFLIIWKMLKFINKNINIKYFIFLNKYEDCI